MKKKILLISSILLTFILIVFISLNNTNNENKNVLSNTNKDKQVINSNMITMMYETEAGTGIYEETKDTTWPESGYIFNENLSGCENGGELEYNSINNTVNLLSNKSDNCYVYFDKYDGVWIDNVSVTNVTGSSVTLSVSATSENGSITKYYYSLNDSEEYQEVTSNIITINDLNKLTEYKISIYAIDSTNAKSNIYEVTVSTTYENKPVINSIEVSNITDKGFTLTVNATSEVEIVRFYYVIESENISGTSNLNKYTFTDLIADRDYDVKIFIKSTNGIYSDDYELTVKTNKNPILLADYIKSIYTSQGSNGLYYHTSSLANSAADNSYRYAGANPNNYVCFGSNASTCPSDNLYRIIGVFGLEVKLIKWDYANRNLLGTLAGYYGDYGQFDSYYKGNYTSVDVYMWNPSGSNTWDNNNSFVNTNLNINYLNNIGSEWAKLIATHIWYVGGNTSQDETPKTYYDSESTGTTWNGKIGLMYVSDYGYAVSPDYSDAWTETLWLDYDSNINYNWMHMGLYEWTISRRSSTSSQALRVISRGELSDGPVTGTGSAVRPVFYLNSDVQYVSGTGSQSDPFRIE